MFVLLADPLYLGVFGADQVHALFMRCSQVLPVAAFQDRVVACRGEDYLRAFLFEAVLADHVGLHLAKLAPGVDRGVGSGLAPGCDAEGQGGCHAGVSFVVGADQARGLVGGKTPVRIVQVDGGEFVYGHGYLACMALAIFLIM